MVLAAPVFASEELDDMVIFDDEVSCISKYICM
jgi:fructose-1,6-bisphosphatase